MQKTLSILPTRRKSGSAFYEYETFSPNPMQMRTTVKGYDPRYRKPFPWLAAVMFFSGAVGIVWLLISVSQ